MRAGGLCPPIPREARSRAARKRPKAARSEPEASEAGSPGLRPGGDHRTGSPGLRPRAGTTTASARKGARSEAQPSEAGWPGLCPGRDHKTWLLIGCYEMDERNTPGVGAVLAAHGLRCLLEAHCYLRHGGTRVDVTWPAERPAGQLLLANEEVIEPEAIADYKPRRHRELLALWRETSPSARALSLDALWQIRESCIAALGG